MNNNQLACDQERIELFLRQQLSDVEQIEFESHLDDCVACRSAMEQTAASGEAWECVRESLAVKPSLSQSGAATTTATIESDKQDSFSAESVLKMLAPTDDDRMVGRLWSADNNAQRLANGKRIAVLMDGKPATGVGAVITGNVTEQEAQQLAPHLIREPGKAIAKVEIRIANTIASPPQRDERKGFGEIPTGRKKGSRNR